MRGANASTVTPAAGALISISNSKAKMIDFAEKNMMEKINRYLFFIDEKIGQSEIKETRAF